MVLDRREFLKIAGFAAAGMTAGLPGDLLQAGELPPPSTGTRWAMVIDIKKCLEYDIFDKCSTACHGAHNVPDMGNPKDEVKWIWTEHFQHAFHNQNHSYVNEDLKHKNVIVLCNHCDNPPCVRVCPTQTTWKREDGIVMMDQHRCIGCRYCMAACPYGSRSFNWKDPRPFVKNLNPDFPTRAIGVVEKCTFCAARLSRGLQPACVEVCQNEEMVFGNLNDAKSRVRQLLETNFTLRRKPSLGTNPEVYYIV